jgi:GH24 family phage-related lysozyme (muramidase)
LTGEWCPINDEVMEVSLKLIKEGEGLVLHAYRDTLNYWTIGYGHLILENDNFS